MLTLLKLQMTSQKQEKHSSLVLIKTVFADRAKIVAVCCGYSFHNTNRVQTCQDCISQISIDTGQLCKWKEFIHSQNPLFTLNIHTLKNLIEIC